MKIIEKIKSRKFQVFLIWAIGFLVAILTKSLPESVSLEIVKGFSFVSICYIGGNVAQDFAMKEKTIGR